MRPIFWTGNLLQEFAVEFTKTNRPNTSEGRYDTEETKQPEEHESPWGDDDTIRWIETLRDTGPRIQAGLVKELLQR